MAQMPKANSNVFQDCNVRHADKPALCHIMSLACWSVLAAFVKQKNERKQVKLFRFFWRGSAKKFRPCLNHEAQIKPPKQKFSENES